MKTYREYIEKFYGRGSSIQDYLKNEDIIDIQMASLVIDGSVSQEVLEEWDGGIIQAEKPVDILDKQGTYETIGRHSKYEPFKYYGQCFMGSMKNQNPALGRKVYVCSPYNAKTPEQIEVNVTLAKSVCKAIVEAGNYPVAPHLYFPQFMNEKSEAEREFGIMAGLQLMNGCDEVMACVVNDYISPGMERELTYAANNLGIPIDINYLDRKGR